MTVVSWKPPEARGDGGPLEYQVHVTTEGSVWQTLSTKAVLTDLAPNVAHTFTVQAMNAYGFSPSSLPSRPVALRSRHTPDAHQPVGEVARLVAPPIVLAQHLSDLPDDAMNIEAAALLISKSEWPETELDASEAEIGAIVHNVTEYVGDRTDPDWRIRAINTVLYYDRSYQYDQDDHVGRKYENFMLGHYLATKNGNCVTMPLLYYIVAQRLHYPIYFVAAPNHLFLRYDDGQYRSIVEATRKGGPNTEDEAIKKFGVTREGIASGIYMKNLTTRQAMAGLIVQIASAEWAQQRRWVTEPIYRAALALDHNNVAAHAALAIIYQGRAEQDAGMGMFDVLQSPWWQQAMYHAHEVTRLGCPPPVTDDYIKNPPSEPNKPFDLAGELLIEEGVIPGAPRAMPFGRFPTVRTSFFNGPARAYP